MAKYTIVHECCGYTEEVQIYGKEADRPSRAAWLAKQPCTGCRARAARESGITEGTDKQVAWAADIRDQMVRTVREGKGASEEAAAALPKIEEWVRYHSDARWYIDNKDAGSSLLTIAELIPEDELMEMTGVQR